MVFRMLFLCSGYVGVLPWFFGEFLYVWFLDGRSAKSAKNRFFQIFFFRGISTFLIGIRLAMDQKEGAALIFIIFILFKTLSVPTSILKQAEGLTNTRQEAFRPDAEWVTKNSENWIFWVRKWYEFNLSLERFLKVVKNCYIIRFWMQFFYYYSVRRLRGRRPKRQ